MNKITYEELERLYNEASRGTITPNQMVVGIGSLPLLRKAFGDEAVDEALKTGRLVVPIEEDDSDADT